VTYDDFGGGLFEPPVSGAGQTAPVEDMAPNEFLAFDNWSFSNRGKGIHTRNGITFLAQKSGLNITHVCGIPGTNNLLVGGVESADNKVYLFNGSTFTLVRQALPDIRQLFPHNNAVYMAIDSGYPQKITPAGVCANLTTALANVVRFDAINGRLIALEAGDDHLWVAGLDDDTHWAGDDSGRVRIPQSADFGTLLTFSKMGTGVALFTTRGVWVASGISLSGFEIRKVSDEVTIHGSFLRAVQDIGGGVVFISTEGKPCLATAQGVRSMCRGVLGTARTFKDSIAFSERLGQVIVPDNTASALVVYTGHAATKSTWPMGRFTSNMISGLGAVCCQTTTTKQRLVYCTTDGKVYEQGCLQPDESGFIKDDVSGSTYYQIPAAIRTRPESVGVMNLKRWKEARLYLNSIPGITTISVTQYFGNPHGGDSTSLTASPGRCVSVPVSGVREHTSLNVAFSDSTAGSTAKTSHVYLNKIELDFLPGPRQ